MASGWDGYGSTSSRIYLKNLSWGISKATIAKYFTGLGFRDITEASVQVVRRGCNANGRLCTAFVSMLSWSDVDQAVTMIHGASIPCFSYKQCHAERAIPRLQTMVPRAAKSDHVDKKYQDKEERENAETNDAENFGAETQNADLTPNSAAAKQVDKWTTVKKESDHDDPAPMVEALKFQEAMLHPRKKRKEKK